MGEPHADPLPQVTPGIPFTTERLLQELNRVPISKAVAYPFLPSLTIRTHADSIAPLIMDWLNHWWRSDDPWILSCWRDGWMCYLGKPNKAADRPGNLRGITLQEPLGKCVLTVIAKEAQLQAMDELCRILQFAYLPGRSAQDALNRAIAHRQEVENLLGQFAHPAHQKAAGIQPPPIVGGIELFLDISRAFDCIPKGPFFHYLCQLPIDERLVKLISCWRHGARYHAVHKNESHPIPTGKGIRAVHWRPFFGHPLCACASTK